MELLAIIEALCTKRPLFHSEADFQFALAWEIQRMYTSADVRLEYPPKNEPNKYIDIMVRNGEHSYPIELKYKTKRLSTVVDGEQYHLKNHGAQDIGAYDFVKDICRVESFASHLDGFKYGYVLWLTNDPYYWKAPHNENVGYAAFSVHQGAKKSGVMAWANHLSAGTIKGREKEISLKGNYEILWSDYSNLGVLPGIFKYALMRVERNK